MCTRAQFFIGNPENLESRRWLGSTVWDSHPDGWVASIECVTSEGEFESFVTNIAGVRDDFCDPKKHGFPLPWTDNLFLTEITYAFFDGKVMLTWFNRGWISFEDYIRGGIAVEKYHLQRGQLPITVPAPMAPAWVSAEAAP